MRFSDLDLEEPLTIDNYVFPQLAHFDMLSHMLYCTIDCVLKSVLKSAMFISVLTLGMAYTLQPVFYLYLHVPVPKSLENDLLNW